MLVPITDIIFIDDNPFVCIEGVDEYLKKYNNGEPINPLTIFFEKDGKKYARGGRHRTFMFYHKLNQTHIETKYAERFPYNDDHDKKLLKDGGVSIHDLVEDLC